MKIIKAKYKILTKINGIKMLKHIEKCGRVCYKSEGKITNDSYIDFIKNLIKKGHESVLEHSSFSVKFYNDRGVSHEEVRHRIASFSQESTRYCNYSKDKFVKSITVIDIKDFLVNPLSFETWLECMKFCEMSYLKMIENGETPQIARSVLPNSLKTEIVISANIREWREIFRQRTASSAHPQMREVMIPLLQELKTRIPIVFDDIII